MHPGIIMFENKYRELVVEPGEVRFEKIRIAKILEYLHAGNDVIHCVDQRNVHYVIKFSRHDDADFNNEISMLENMKEFDWLHTPRVIESGVHKGTAYIVLSYVQGYRISQQMEIYRKNQNLYCNKFGENIGRIHKIEGNFARAKKRKFHLVVENTKNDQNIESINAWLAENATQNVNECFVHGDHHYANILWFKNRISGTLDWELAGIGNKEYDIAWSIVVRPGQTFFMTENEETEILNGYLKHNQFDYKKYEYYKILVISHFYKYRKESSEYESWMKKEIKKITRLEMQ